MLWRLNIDPSIWSRRCQFPIQTAIYANGQTTYQQFMPVSLQLAAGMDASGKEDKSANEFHAQQMGRIQPWWRSRTGYRFPSNSRQNRNHVIQTTSSKKIYLATERMKIKHQMLKSSLVFFFRKSKSLVREKWNMYFQLAESLSTCQVAPTERWEGNSSLTTLETAIRQKINFEICRVGRKPTEIPRIKKRYYCTALDTNCMLKWNREFQFFSRAATRLLNRTCTVGTSKFFHWFSTALNFKAMLAIHCFLKIIVCSNPHNKNSRAT